MPAVAEVQFKATGSQQVEQAFKSVGTAAQDGSTKIQQNSNALKSMGTGMKSSISSIGQVTTAFATLSLSIVNTYRSYRDLGDAQLAVDRANLKVSKTQNAIRLLEKDIAKDRKEGTKGSLAYAIASNKIVQAEQKLAKDRKDGKHTAAELKGEELAIAKMRKDGVGNTQQLTDKETKLNLLREQLGIATTNAGEAQERFNDIQQNFYLSIIPTALSSLGLLTTAFKGLGGALRGGGGLIGGLGPIGLILGGLSLAVIAFQTNFLGLRDTVGGVIQWLKDRFGVWKQTIEDVFNLIRKGDWGAVFNKIKEAAIKFWADLVKTVPFFGTVSDIIEKIKKGDWAGAFNIIATAAETAWATLVAKVPFFGGVATLIDQIKKGDWSGAFNTISAAFQEAFKMIGGEGLVLKIQRLRDTAYAEFNLMKDQLTKKGGPLDLIQQGLAKIGQGDFAGGFSNIWAGFDKAVGIFITRANDWIKMNFGIDLVNLGTQALAIGNTILTKIQEGMTFISTTWIDPILSALLDPVTWIQGFIAMGGFFVKIGTALYTAIGTALGNAAKDPKGAATWWADLGNAIWTGLSDWFKINLPGATKAMEGIAQSLVDGVEAAKTQIQNVGIAIWNQIIEGIRAFTGGAASPFGGALDALKKTPLELPVKPIILADSKKTVIDTIQNYKPAPTLPLQLDTKKPQQQADQFKNRIERQKYIAHIDANLAAANAKWNQFARKVQMTTLQVKIAGTSVNIRKGSQAGAYGGKQHGYQSTVHRPTLFMAGEGGRPEDVTVRPRGSVQRGGGGGGGFYGTVNVYVDGVLRPARYDMGARK